MTAPESFIGGWCADGKFRYFTHSCWLCMGFNNEKDLTEWILDNFKEKKYYKDFKKIEEKEFLNFERDEIKNLAEHIYYLTKRKIAYRFARHEKFKKKYKLQKDGRDTALKKEINNIKLKIEKQKKQMSRLRINLNKNKKELIKLEK